MTNFNEVVAFSLKFCMKTYFNPTRRNMKIKLSMDHIMSSINVEGVPKYDKQ